MTTNPDVHTLTGPYVLDALPDEERRDFENHLAYCAACTTEVVELREAAVKLSTQVATPPPAHLRANVLASISQVRQLPPLVDDDSAGPDGVVVAPRGGFGRRSMLALAAAALAVAASGGIAIDQYRERTVTTRNSDQVAAVLAEPDVRTVHGDVSGGGQATVVTSTRKDAAVVVLRGLQPLPSGRTYQLWLMDRTQAAHSVGLVDNRATGQLTKVISGGVAGKVDFGVTVEPEGGSAKPTLPAAALLSMA
jgi:anti-sigma-K factor RskA